MRKFINICESMVPQVDREEIINHMISHVHAGDYWDREARPKGATAPIDDSSALDMASDWGFATEDGMGVDLDNPGFLPRLHQWGEARYDEVIARLNAVPLHAGRYALHRLIRVPAGFQPADGLGIYWTFDVHNADFEAPWSEHDYGTSAELVMHALVEPQHIDWRLTILANMDWMSGDAEYEMRLIKGSPVMLLDVDGESVNKVFRA